MQYILIILPLASLVFSFVSGTTAEMSSALLQSTGDAVTLVLSICGMMCFWCGMMKVAEKAGAVQALSRVMTPVVSRLFSGIDKRGRAMMLITLNLTANILGLGNATTPLGISAMQALADEEGVTDTASDSMVLLTVLNTASLQIIPSTMAALRLAQGAARPMDVLPCVWIVSAYSVAVAVLAAKLFSSFGKRGRG